MIVLDTHIWVWNIQGDPRLSSKHLDIIRSPEAKRIGIPAISLWEVAKAVELGRLTLSEPIETWFEIALMPLGVEIIPLTPEIAVESTRLPGQFHKDPFDQLIVATARVYDVPLVTVDSAILEYPFVKLIPG
ncbi:MAG: type II toxin-antitoxin system VapC family toxin [Pyrinomonadaceae bacterium]